MLKIVYVFLFVSFISIVKAQDNKTYNKDNISFEYPSRWIARDFPNYYILISEPPKDVVSVMATFDVEINDSIKSLKKFCNNYEEKLKNSKVFQHVDIFLKLDYKFKGYDAMYYSWTAMMQNLPVEWISIIFIKDKKIYKLSTTG